MPAIALCPKCGKSPLHHSRTRSWFERMRRRITGQVPFRCHACNWRVWRDELGPGGNGPREIHRELTDSEIAQLEPDNSD